MKQLIQQFNSLLREGRYAEAEDQAAAEALEASSPILRGWTAAALESRLTSNAELNAVVRDQGQKQYLAAMRLTDVSAIPFPDCPADRLSAGRGGSRTVDEGPRRLLRSST